MSQGFVAEHKVLLHDESIMLCSLGSLESSVVVVPQSIMLCSLGSLNNSVAAVQGWSLKEVLHRLYK